jgi:hypothetical protein
VGAPRSGTTLVAAILDSHSRLAVYIESHYYVLFRPIVHRYGDLARSGNLRRFVRDVRDIIRIQDKISVPGEREFFDALVAPTFEGVLATLLKLHARQAGKARAGEKTPGHHPYLGEILERFPGSPVIFMMRDPRDLVMSMRAAFGTSLKGAAWAWNHAFRSYQAARQSVHLLRYEDLVDRPEERAALLCQAVGEPYESGMLRFHERMQSIAYRIRPQHRRILGPVDRKVVNRFRQMPRRDIEWIESACAEGMETLGYDFAFGTPRVRPMSQPGRTTLFVDRLRFYGMDRVRWRRAATRWNIALRARMRQLLSWTGRPVL